MSSSHSKFQLEAIFTSGFVLKVKSYLRELFFQFLILPGCYFHQLDLFTMSYCICGSSFFLFVTKAILIMPGKQMHSTYLSISSMVGTNTWNENIITAASTGGYTDFCRPWSTRLKCEDKLIYTKPGWGQDFWSPIDRLRISPHLKTNWEIFWPHLNFSPSRSQRDQEAKVSSSVPIKMFQWKLRMGWSSLSGES